MSRALLLALALAGCGDNLHLVPPPDASLVADAAIDAAVDAPIDAPPDANPLQPMHLEDTGLYSDFENQVIAPENIEYVPQFKLWSDGATKRRWVYLPPGSTIDSSDMDYWSYPEGTKIWKEFTRGGLRVETRLLWKQGPDPSDWRPFTFVWNAAQDATVLETNGVKDALGTGHDVPGLFACYLCHQKQPDFVLGFSAIQLDNSGDGFGLDDLVADNRLTDPPAGTGPTFFPLPGDEVDQAALGYLHGNCGGCHNDRADLGAAKVELRLMVGAMSDVTSTRAYLTAVNQPTAIDVGATAIIEPGDPAASAIHIRMESLVPGTRMPEVGSSVVDTVGLAAIDAWINQVPPQQ